MNHRDEQRKRQQPLVLEQMTGPELRKFVAPELLYGLGARHKAALYARNLGGHKVLLVSDPGVEAAGWTGQIRADLRDEGLSWASFEDVSPNPHVGEVIQGAECYQAEGCDVIVAVGGGSVIDAAKGIGLVVSNHRPITSFEGADQVVWPGPPLVCVPTTAGSAADVSQFAIITDPQRRLKMAIISKKIVPDVALIDPETTTTMDGLLTATTGFDTLTHAIEAYVSNASSPLTDVHALAAAGLVTRNLAAAVAEPLDLKARDAMMLATLHAGLAFSNASLGLVHALAHSLGGWSDANHGLTNSILLPIVIEYNNPSVTERYSQLSAAMGFGSDTASLITGVRRLSQEIGLDQSLDISRIGHEDIVQLARNTMKDPCLVTNPRYPRIEEVQTLYERLLTA